MNQFQQLKALQPFPCDICGKPMRALMGGGWDNDRIICSDLIECGAEIEFPTSTPVPEEPPAEGLSTLDA